MVRLGDAPMLVPPTANSIATAASTEQEEPKALVDPSIPHLQQLDTNRQGEIPVDDVSLALNSHTADDYVEKGTLQAANVRFVPDQPSMANDGSVNHNPQGVPAADEEIMNLPTVGVLGSTEANNITPKALNAGLNDDNHAPPNEKYTPSGSILAYEDEDMIDLTLESRVQAETTKKEVSQHATGALNRNFAVENYHGLPVVNDTIDLTAGNSLPPPEVKADSKPNYVVGNGTSSVRKGGILDDDDEEIIDLVAGRSLTSDATVKNEAPPSFMVQPNALDTGSSLIAKAMSSNHPVTPSSHAANALSSNNIFNASQFGPGANSMSVVKKEGIRPFVAEPLSYKDPMATLQSVGGNDNYLESLNMLINGQNAAAGQAALQNSSRNPATAQCRVDAPSTSSC